MKTSFKLVGVLLLGILSACGGSDEKPQPVKVAIVVNPSSTNVPTGGKQTFQAAVSGTNNVSVSWKIDEGSAGGTIDAAGVYSAPTAKGTFHITATSAADSTKSATAEVNVLPVAVAVTPETVTLSTAGSVTFSANVGGALDNTVSWSVDEEAGGSVDDAGKYTAPTTAGTYHVSATSTADGSKVGHATIVVQAVGVTLTPETSSVNQGGTVFFTASVANSDDSAVTWSVQEGSAGGAVDATGQYTAPFKAGTYHVVATSVADPSKSATGAITVNGVTLSVAPTTVELGQGASQTFVATMTGTTSADVTWSVSGTAGGTIDATGKYTAGTQQGSDTVVATYKADTTVTASATVTVPEATGLSYVDPTDSTQWRLVRSAASTPGHLVLDLLGPDGGSGYGVAFSLSLPANATWAAVDASGPDYVINRAFNLGSAPQLSKVQLQGATLNAGIFQKGSASPAVSYTKPLASVALDYAGTGETSGAPIALSVIKAQARNGTTGAMETIAIQVGQLAAK